MHVACAQRKFYFLSKELIICICYNFSVGARAQNSILGLGPWALSEDMDRSEEEEQIIVKRFQLKSQRWGIGERLSEEELLLGYDEYSSQYELHQLA